MGCLLGQTRNEPSLASDGNRKAAISAAIHWWLCWKMTYSVSKLFMVLRRCQSLVNLYPCFLFGIHFIVTWVHIAKKKGFYFSGRVLEFGITVSQSVFISVVLFLSRQMSDLLVSYYEKLYNTFQLTKTTPSLNQSVSKVLCRLVLTVSQDVCRLALVLMAVRYLEHINCILCIKTSLHAYGQQNSLFLNNSLAVNASCWFWPRKSSRGRN